MLFMGTEQKQTRVSQRGNQEWGGAKFHKLTCGDGGSHDSSQGVCVRFIRKMSQLKESTLDEVVRRKLEGLCFKAKSLISFSRTSFAVEEKQVREQPLTLSMQDLA
jgi:hypothetical protein